MTDWCQPPFYTSALHMWNGAADDLNINPAMIIARPSNSIESCECPAAAILSKESAPVRP